VYGVAFKTVDTCQQAETVRNVLKTECNGMIRVTRKYARGYDLKLLRDSIVIVVADGKKIRFSEVKQMFGRGCRR